MKKILTVFAALAMVAGLASSCQKEGVSTENPAQGELVQVKLTAALEDVSKVFYYEDDNILTPAWEMDDAILVINPSVDPSTLTVTSIDGDGYATLEGTAEPGLVHLVYKKGITTGDWQGNKIDVDYDEQKVNDDMPAVMFADGQVSSNGSGSFNFRNAGAVIGIYNAKGVPEGSEISKVTLSGSNLSAATVSISGNALVLTATEKAKDAISTETLSDITVTTGETATLSEGILIAVPCGAKVEKVTLSVGEDTYSYTLTAAKTCNANDYLYVKTQEFKKDVVLPKGALPGVFTVSDNGGETTKQVHFSQGNLYWDGSAFKFEANQYSGTTYAENHVSHFYWSKFDDEAVGQGFNPYQDFDDTDVFFTNADGFKVNVGGTDQTGWCTLSTNEWQYLFDERNNASNLYEYGVTVCGKTNCVVLLPDNWQWEASTVGTGWQTGGYPETQTGTEVTWEKMEKAGAVCLPAAGSRDGSNVSNVGDFGFYWSSTAGEVGGAYSVHFDSGDVCPGSHDHRYCGFSVRLITESK